MLRDLDGLQTLSRAEYVSLIGNNTLQNVDGLSGLHTIDGGLAISNNPQLTNLDGLDTLQSVAAIDVKSNERLMDCSHIVAVTTASAWSGANADGGTCQKAWHQLTIPHGDFHLPKNA